MHRLTLRTKFILIISAVFLAAAVAVLFFYTEVTSRIINEFALRVATRQALHDKNKILSIIDREVALSLKLSDDAVVRRWVARADDPALKSAALQQLESYRRFFRDQNYFVARNVDLSYFNADRTSPPGQPKTSQLSSTRGADSWYFKTLERVSTFELNLDYNVLIKKTNVWINVIIRDDQGAKIGIGGTGLDLTDFLESIVNSGEPGVSAILVDRRGVIQAHQNHGLVERNALEQNPEKRTTIYNLLNDPDSNRQLQETLASLSGDSQKKVAAFPLKMGKETVFAAVAFMPEIGWYTIALVDITRAMKPEAFLPIILASVLSLLAVILVIGFLINRLVLQPLGLLTSASREVAEGNYDISLPVKRNDEIGVLTGSFNTMAAMVRDHTAHLEERVQQRTLELTRANEQLEESQARIMESLHYAQVIQASILPPPQCLDRAFAEYFVLYRPCDIVGGDLYWLRERPDGRLLVAVMDCTGHGVPGAFMTMTVNSVLNHIVDTICADDPPEILREMNRMLQETLRLRKDGESLVDAGLEIALCHIDRSRRSLVFAGAGISLYLAGGEQLREIRGDRQRVGYSGSDLNFAYQAHQLDLAPGTVCYLTTDGFLDEGGGTKGYGFGAPRFRELLEGQRGVPLSDQQRAFEQRINDWRGERKQRDDITVFGFRW